MNVNVQQTDGRLQVSQSGEVNSGVCGSPDTPAAPPPNRAGKSKSHYKQSKTTEPGFIL